MIKVGARVIFTWFKNHDKTPYEIKVKGTIEEIDGAYHIIKVDDTPGMYVELYPNEFEVIENEQLPLL